jgi:hypothetical protein
MAAFEAGRGALDRCAEFPPKFGHKVVGFCLSVLEGCSDCASLTVSRTPRVGLVHRPIVVVGAVGLIGIRPTATRDHGDPARGPIEIPGAAVEWIGVTDARDRVLSCELGGERAFPGREFHGLERKAFRCASKGGCPAQAQIGV